MRGVSRAAAMVAVFAVLAGPPALAQQVERADIANRLNRLEADLNALQGQVYKGAGPAATPGGGTPQTQLVVRMTDLETQIRDLTGRVEEVAHGLSQMMKRLDALQADNEVRFQTLERTLAAMPPAGATAASGQPAASATLTPPAPAGTDAGAVRPLGETPNPSVSAPAADLPDGTPQQQYDHAFSLVIQADYAAAEKALAAFLAAHPKDPLAANAAYWLAETFYVRKQFAEAAVRFADSYKTYPKGSKAPDSLLKLGMSFAALDQKAEACKSFDEVAKRYPDASPRIIQHAAREKKRLECA